MNTLKKTIAILSLLALPMMPAIAQYTGPNMQPAVITVKQLQETGWNDQHVALRGRIVGRINHKYYRFADDSGQILIELKPKYIPFGLNFSDKNIVEIRGEFDKEWHKESKVEVYSIAVIK